MKKNHKLLNSILLLFCIFNAEVNLAQDKITLKSINDFLVKEQRLMVNKDIEGYMDLFTNDYINVSKEGNKRTKAEYRLGVYNSLFASLHILHKSTLKSAEIDEDGKTAKVVLINDTKYLVERFNKKFVIQSLFEGYAELILIDGEIKYRMTKQIKEL